MKLFIAVCMIIVDLCLMYISFMWDIFDIIITNHKERKLQCSGLANREILQIQTCSGLAVKGLNEVTCTIYRKVCTQHQTPIISFNIFFLFEVFDLYRFITMYFISTLYLLTIDVFRV